MNKYDARRRRAARDNWRQLATAKQRGETVYGALPEEHEDGLGIWQFVRGHIVEITPRRTRSRFGLLKKITDCNVTVRGADGELVTLLASQVRWRGPEVFTSTAISFSDIALATAERLTRERDHHAALLEGTIKRPYDYSGKDSRAAYRAAQDDLDALQPLARDLDELATTLSEQFDYPQKRMVVHGSQRLYTKLREASMGRLPFYQQLALCVLDHWAYAYGEERTGYQYRTWMHDDAYHVLPNIAHLAVKGCAVGPDAKLGVDDTPISAKVA